MASSVAFWRKWHRWIGFPATIFLLWVAGTGVVVAGTEFFGEDEALRERTRDMVSTVTVASPATDWSDPVSRALSAVAARKPGAPIDKIQLQLKGDAPTVTIFTGLPKGGEDRRYVVDAKTGAVLVDEDYADKPLVYRLHSGEAFGDGGLVFAMGWGIALVALTITGFMIWLRIRRKDATGIRKWFW